MLTRIRELGAGLALDDFGTGHSSLAYLQRFPFDTIKIDQSFVRTNSKGTRPVILRSIIALAHDLGMDVVAEGAETDSDAVELYQLGCEYAQGFVFGEPMTAEAARELLMAEQLEAGALIADRYLATGCQPAAIQRSRIAGLVSAATKARAASGSRAARRDRGRIDRPELKRFGQQRRKLRALGVDFADQHDRDLGFAAWRPWPRHRCRRWRARPCARLVRMPKPSAIFIRCVTDVPPSFGSV